MNIKNFIKILGNDTFYTGVPDSRLKPLSDYLLDNYGIGNNHIIAANEGSAVALAAGYHLSTGRVPCVYLQNSGLGNIINPVASLLNNNVYGIPCIFIIGWRGEPGIHDEPQHTFQGKVTLKTLELMDIAYMVLDEKTTSQEAKENMIKFNALLEKGKSIAFVVKKGGLYYDKKTSREKCNKTSRENIIEAIVDTSKDDVIVSTTGKTSRELFEIREKKGQSHKYDFLTVGSMGHSSSIALGIALNKPGKRVWCIDGDGAALMHLGGVATIGAKKPDNLIHVLINNAAHESVGGQPTIGDKISFVDIALSCGYRNSYSAKNLDELNLVLVKIKSKKGPIFIEAKSAIGSRDNLGRPTTTPVENKESFMNFLREEK